MTDILKLMREKYELEEKHKGILDKCRSGGSYSETEWQEYKKIADHLDEYKRRIKEAKDEQERRIGNIPGATDALVAELRQGSIDEPGSFRGARSPQQQAGFQPTGYSTEHKDLAGFIRDVRFPTERRVMSMGVGTSGGFMVPDQLLKDVLTTDLEEFVISNRATPIGPFAGAPDAATTIPSLDVSGDNGEFGGIELKWLSEGGTKHETEPELLEVKLEPQEIAGYVTVTDKLIRNGGDEFNVFLRKTLGKALNAACERAYLSGTGVGMPTGITQSACRIEVPRAGGGAIAYQDLVDMISQFGPNTWSKGIWMVSQSALASLLVMPDPGAAGTLILKPSDLRLGTPANMMGLPVFVSSRVPPLGSTADLMLLEPSYYLKKMGSGPFILASDAPLFTENKTIIKIFGNFDGQSWLVSSVLMENGTDRLSPFILLEA